MKRVRRRSLAAPIVLTLSAAPACKSAGPAHHGGCEPPECHMNPPPPPPESATPRKEPLPVAKGPELCTATGGKRPCVERQRDGTCVLREDDHCPDGAKCNPPPPSPVPCP